VSAQFAQQSCTKSLTDATILALLAGCKPGDLVLLPDYGGQMVNLGNKGGEKSEKELFLYRDEEILGKVETRK